MKTTSIIVLLFLISSTLFSQNRNSDYIKVNGTGTLISSWKGSDSEDIWGVLANGNKISISKKQSFIYVTVYATNVGTHLIALDLENDEIKDTLVKVYEYDFDKNGGKELVVIYSTAFSFLNVEVFRFVSGISERIGNFKGQFEVYLENDTVFLPIGSQGIGDEFMYKDYSFYKLILHNPENN